MSQLEDNLGALDLRFSKDQLDRLTEVSKLKKPYPYGFLERYNLVN